MGRLSETWRKVQYELSARDIIWPAPVQEELEKKGWKFDQVWPEVKMMHHLGVFPFIDVVSPEGKRLSEKGVSEQYYQARREAAARVFKPHTRDYTI